MAAYFSIAFLFTWTFQIAALFAARNIISLPFAPKLLLLLSIFGPFVAAFCLTFRESGRRGAFKLFRSGFDWKFDPKIYLFVALVPLLTSLVSYLIVGGKTPNVDLFSLAASFVVYFFLGGSFGEEFGWRGFALPRLLTESGAAAATLILGLFWAFWHLPLFFLEGSSQFYTPFWLYLVYVVALAFQYTWVYLKTNGNIFACLLLHTFPNITVEVFPIEATDGVDPRIYYETFFAVVVAAILLIFDRHLRLKKPAVPVFKEHK